MSGELIVPPLEVKGEVTMGSCSQCRCLHPTVNKLPVFPYAEDGINLLLLDAVSEEVCKECGEVSHSIANPKGLIAAAAVYRSTIDVKLNSAEIKFMRKAMGKSSKDLAAALGVTVETMSRWENNKATIGQEFEKLLRLNVIVELKDRAPLIVVSPESILQMKINPMRPQEKITLCLQLIKKVMKEEGESSLEDVYMKAKAA